MSIKAKSTSYVQTLRLKKIGLFLASLWVVVLVAGVASTIYREVDGPTVRSVVSKNLNLSSVNASLSGNLDSAKAANEAFESELMAAKLWYESHITSIPLGRKASATPHWLNGHLRR